MAFNDIGHVVESLTPLGEGPYLLYVPETGEVPLSNLPNIPSGLNDSDQIVGPPYALAGKTG